MANPKANRFLMKSDFDEAVQCVACNKDVYPNDKVIALGGYWHRGCLKCTECKITLNVRSLESFDGKPYCRAHKPNPKLTAVTDAVAIKQATTAPKAVRREAGVKKDVRMSFMPGAKGAPNPLTNVQAAPHAFTPQTSSGVSAPRRVQGVNKLERMTFAPGASKPISPASATPTYDQGGDYGQTEDHSASGYGAADQGGYDQGGDYGAADQGGDYGAADQGGYDQGGEYGAADQGGEQQYYEEGGEQGYEDQQYYEEGGEQGYEDQQYYDDQNQGEEGW